MAPKVHLPSADGDDYDPVERSTRPKAPETARPVATEDLRIPRPELGPGAVTLVVKGDEIPPGLTAPTTPTTTGASRKRTRK